MLYCIVLVKKMDIPDIGISQFMSEKKTLFWITQNLSGTAMNILKIVNYI